MNIVRDLFDIERNAIRGKNLNCVFHQDSQTLTYVTFTPDGQKGHDILRLKIDGDKNFRITWRDKTYQGEPEKMAVLYDSKMKVTPKVVSGMSREFIPVVERLSKMDLSKLKRRAVEYER